MNTQMSRIYGNSKAYDLAFSYRDFPLETAKLIDWYGEATGASAPPRTALELACGPARYPIELTRNGIRAAGLDLSDEMCAYAGALAEDLGFEVRIERADMVEFELGERYDLVILMLNSLGQIVEAQALARHFESVARHLSDKGVYVIEDGRCPPMKAYDAVEWVAESGDDRIRVRWGADGRHEYASITGTLAGAEIDIEDEAPMRKWRTAELMSAARAAGLSLVGHYGPFADDSSEEVAASITLSGAEALGLQDCFCFGRAPA